MHTFREYAADTIALKPSPAAAYDVSKQPSEQIPCCNDHDHSFNKLSRLRTSEKCATIHQQFAVTFCATATVAAAAAASMAGSRGSSRSFELQFYDVRDDDERL